VIQKLDEKPSSIFEMKIFMTRIAFVREIVVFMIYADIDFVRGCFCVTLSCTMVRLEQGSFKSRLMRLRS
jgi:hypothetical protein